jgi:hypothetical protein
LRLQAYTTALGQPTTSMGGFATLLWRKLHNVKWNPHAQREVHGLDSLPGHKAQAACVWLLGMVGLVGLVLFGIVCLYVSGDVFCTLPHMHGGRLVHIDRCVLREVLVTAV